MNKICKKRALLFEWTRINDMLDKQLYLTRIESQNNDMYFEYVPLKRLIIEEIQLTRYLSQAKGIGYELDSIIRRGETFIKNSR